ncbi:MAG: YegS/Rv2252/BmrU family lipid kinase, partial [candidate division WOR-3 bacterium]
MKEIKEYLKKSGCFPVVTSTRYKNHAKIIAMDAVNNNFDLIISVGGDGTINEIINGMMDCKDLVRKLPALGIISSGTGADLCRTLNIPFEYQKGIDIIMKGKLMPLDIGVVKFKIGPHSYQRYFVNVFDVGLGGNVVRIANHIPKNLGGFLTFLLSSFAGLLTHTPVFLKIYVDDTLIDKDYITIIGAANGKFFGGGMQIAPMAEINDGYLEVLYVKNTNIFKFIKNV